MGKLFVITGPSGAGKDSVIFKAKELGLQFAQIVTTSTREVRPGESEGFPYYFVTKEAFEKAKVDGEMVEWAEVYGNFYGCSKKELEAKIGQNKITIVKVDPQGARTYKKMYPEAVTIFIMPPSYEYLEKRLINRDTDSRDTIKKRLTIARKELENLLNWDYLVVNEEGKLQAAAEEIIEIINKCCL